MLRAACIAAAVAAGLGVLALVHTNGLAASEMPPEEERWHVAKVDLGQGPPRCTVGTIDNGDALRFVVEASPGGFRPSLRVVAGALAELGSNSGMAALDVGGEGFRLPFARDGREAVRLDFRDMQELRAVLWLVADAPEGALFRVNPDDGCVVVAFVVRGLERALPRFEACQQNLA